MTEVLRYSDWPSYFRRVEDSSGRLVLGKCQCVFEGDLDAALAFFSAYRCGSWDVVTLVSESGRELAIKQAG